MADPVLGTTTTQARNGTRRSADQTGGDLSKYRSSARRMFLAPLTAILLALTVVPFVYNIYISLTDKAAANPTTRFIWFDNYVSLLQDSLFWSSIRITIMFTVVVVLVELAIALAVALALARISRGAPLLRAFFLIPMAAAPVAVLFNWRVMLNVSYGVIDYVLGILGLPQPDWTGDPSTALTTLMIVDIWQWTPFVLIIVAGGLASLPGDIYEASAVDGATAWQNFRYVTLPLLRPYILVAVLFRSIDALKTFDSVQILTSGGPGSKTTMLNYYIFQQGISYLNFGQAAAAATILLVIATVLARALLGGLKRRRDNS